MAEEALKELEEMGLSTAAVTRSTAQIFSEFVNTCLLAPLQKIRVHDLSTAANLCSRNDNNLLGRMVHGNHKACFFFTFKIICNKKLSLLNCCNKAEITSTPGSPKVYNHTFWRSNLDIKQLRNGVLFSTLEMGFFFHLGLLLNFSNKSMKMPCTGTLIQVVVLNKHVVDETCDCEFCRHKKKTQMSAL